jgi:hypothetical protein
MYKRGRNYPSTSEKYILIRRDIVMGTAESKSNHRHRPNKHIRYKTEPPVIHKCQHKNKQLETLIVGNKHSIKRKNETIGR